jgi:hypothetical protein
MLKFGPMTVTNRPQWLNIIIKNRPAEGERLPEEMGINDMQNGMLANFNLHNAFDSRKVAVLKVRLGLNECC